MASIYSATDFPDWESSFRQLLHDVIEDSDFSSMPKAVLAYLSYLNESGRIRTVVTEEEYVDFDYTAAYTHFYSHAFRPPDKFCTRYLFFGETFDQIGQLSSPRIRESFNGFLVLWPTTPPVIGRTCLPFPEPPTNTRQIMVKARHHVHVNGHELTANGATFASKDYGVSQCATIATWLATDLLHRRFDLRTCSSSEITLLATHSNPQWGRPIPQEHGLDNGQVVHALMELEYSPYVEFFPQAQAQSGRQRLWAGPLYGYLLSGIPVIMMCRFNGNQHAVLAVGMDLDGMPVVGTQKTLSYARTARAIYVHDDRYGPYGKFEFAEGYPIGTLTYGGYGTGQGPGDDPKPRTFENVEVDALIVPLPSGTVSRSEDAHTAGVRHLIELFVNRDPTASVDELACQTYMIRSDELKAESLNWEEDVDDFAMMIRGTSLPKWVWVSEAYSSDVSDPESSPPLGRVILDPTQIRFAKDAIRLSSHMFDYIPPELPPDSA